MAVRYSRRTHACLWLAQEDVAYVVPKWVKQDYLEMMKRLFPVEVYELDGLDLTEEGWAKVLHDHTIHGIERLKTLLIETAQERIAEHQSIIDCIQRDWRT